MDGRDAFRDAATSTPSIVFYWEHRMSCWHSNVVLESDFAFDTHVLFNSRWILERMLSVPAEERARGVLFRHLVAELWPDLARWPIGAGSSPADVALRRWLDETQGQFCGSKHRQTLTGSRLCHASRRP